MGARFAERIDGVVAHRQRQNVLVVVQRLAEFSEREALVSEPRLAMVSATSS